MEIIQPTLQAGYEIFEIVLTQSIVNPQETFIHLIFIIIRRAGALQMLLTT